MEKEIKITIKNGLYEVTLANVNGKEMMLSIGTLLQSVYSHAKQNGVKNDELLLAAEKATEIVSGYFDENMRG